MTLGTFWRVYLVTVALLVLGIFARGFGPAIEGRVAPIRGAQSVAVIERNEDRLCWAWTFDKVRAHIASDNIDVFIGTPSVPSASWTIYNRDTGMPWGIVSQAVEPGRHTLNYCVPLPPYVHASDTVRVRQTAYYPGLLDLWRLSVPFPDVVSPGGDPRR